MVARLMVALWRTARLAEFDAYLGNPQPTGRSSSTYLFQLVPTPRHAAPAPVAAAARLRPIGLAAASMVLLLLLLGGAVVWSRA